MRIIGREGNVEVVEHFDGKHGDVTLLVLDGSRKT